MFSCADGFRLSLFIAFVPVNSQFCWVRREMKEQNFCSPPATAWRWRRKGRRSLIPFVWTSQYNFTSSEDWIVALLAWSSDYSYCPLLSGWGPYRRKRRKYHYSGPAVCWEPFGVSGFLPVAVDNGLRRHCCRWLCCICQQSWSHSKNLILPGQNQQHSYQSGQKSSKIFIQLLFLLQSALKWQVIGILTWRSKWILELWSDTLPYWLLDESLKCRKVILTTWFLGGRPHSQLGAVKQSMHGLEEGKFPLSSLFKGVYLEIHTLAPVKDHRQSLEYGIKHTWTSLLLILFLCLKTPRCRNLQTGHISWVL